MKLYQYDFDLVDGWAPTLDERDAVTSVMLSVLPKAPTTAVSWYDGGGGRPPSVVVIIDLDTRWALEGLSLVIQALNAAFVYVDGYPNQTCVPRPIGGMQSPAVAVGTVDCVGLSATV